MGLSIFKASGLVKVFDLFVISVLIKNECNDMAVDPTELLTALTGGKLSKL